MSGWTCDLPREECPCVCCQLWRCKKERDEARKVARELCRDLFTAPGYYRYIETYPWLEEE